MRRKMPVTFLAYAAVVLVVVWCLVVVVVVQAW